MFGARVGGEEGGCGRFGACRETSCLLSFDSSMGVVVIGVLGVAKEGKDGSGD